MKAYYLLFIKVFFGLSFLFLASNSIAQICSGSWSLQRPLTEQCVSGQWVGWQNTTQPPGCPTNPTYVGTQSNTFTFTNPVEGFTIDFEGFDGAPFCARIEIRINGLFYPLTASNLSDFPPGSICTISFFNNIVLTSDGYITESALGGPSHLGRGRISINNVNATSVTVSTNDGNGSVFSNPFDCVDVVPLDLVNFKGNPVSPCKALLNWQTGIESNIKNIELERSENGNIFNKVASNLPKGSNSNYSVETDNLMDGYFRLRINDIDGNYRFSEIIKVKADCNKPTYTVTPNPTDGMIEVHSLATDEGVLIFDMLGRKLLSFYSPQLSNKFDIGKLSAGFYIVEIVKGNEIKWQQKIIKN